MKLRPMARRDYDKMLEWKNYPETRKFAIFSHKEIKRKDHFKWLGRHVKNFRVIIWQGKVSGAVRVNQNEISIWIDRKFWGKGLATEAIKLVTVEGMTAKIVDGNVASMRAFIVAGYKPIEYKNNYYIWKK